MSKPRVGFLGTGWIGRHRMEAIIATGLVDVAGIADPSAEMADEAQKLTPDAPVVDGIDGLLGLGLDGLVIATPSALHAQQSIAALDAGVAVFCQKPLGRTADEARAVVETARVADRLLSVDFSYRFQEGTQRVAKLAKSGALGRLFAADLVFHNAYGPDKPWFYDPKFAGGGCVMDLGVHLVDLALWVLGFPDVVNVRSQLLSGGTPLTGNDRVEDYAVAQLELAGGTSVRLACSWNLHAGQEAVIAADFYGTQGGASQRNVGGSFYDFESRQFTGTSNAVMTQPPEQWGGRAAADWARRLAAGERFDPEAEGLVRVAEVIDRIYGR